MTVNNGRNSITNADERLVMYERRRMRTQTVLTFVGLIIFGYFFVNYLDQKEAGQRRMQQYQQQSIQIDGDTCTGFCRVRQLWHDITDHQVECRNIP